MRKKEYLKYLKQSVDGNKQYMFELIEIFLKDLPESLKLLEKQIQKRDWLETEKAAHRLKSTVRLMGLLELMNQAEKIEKRANQQAGWTDVLMLLDTFKEGLNEPLDAFKLERESLSAKLGYSPIYST